MKGERTNKGRRKRFVEKKRVEGTLVEHSGKKGLGRRKGSELDHYIPKKDPLAIPIHRMAKANGPNPRKIAKQLGISIERVKDVLDAS